MQSIFQQLLLRLVFDKFFYNFQLVYTARLKSARVVENITIVVREDEFILNIVKATLSTGSSFMISRRRKNMRIQPLLWVRV